MNKENHVYAPAYKEKDIDELVKICDHIIFNSIGQLMRYKEKCIRSGISIGLRINPEISSRVIMQYMTLVRMVQGLE